MLDGIFAAFRAQVERWRQDVAQRRTITQIDPVADATAARARELEDLVVRLEKDSEMLTPREYARLRKTTPQTVCGWIRAGKLKAEARGRSWLIPRSAVPKLERRRRRARRAEQ